MVSSFLWNPERCQKPVRNIEEDLNNPACLKALQKVCSQVSVVLWYMVVGESVLVDGRHWKGLQCLLLVLLGLSTVLQSKSLHLWPLGLAFIWPSPGPPLILWGDKSFSPKCCPVVSIDQHNMAGLISGREGLQHLGWASFPQPLAGSSIVGRSRSSSFPPAAAAALYLPHSHGRPCPPDCGASIRENTDHTTVLLKYQLSVKTDSAW